MSLKKRPWLHHPLWDNITVSNGALILIILVALFSAAIFKIDDRNINALHTAQVENATLQHKTNVIVYKACLSDTVAEQNANLVILQLREVIQSQITVARAMNLTKVVKRDQLILVRLPSFPSLPACGMHP